MRLMGLDRKHRAEWIGKVKTYSITKAGEDGSERLTAQLNVVAIGLG